LIQHKEEKIHRQKPKPGSNLTLFSHLLSRLEPTLAEKHRVQAKFGQFKRLPVTEEMTKGSDGTDNNKASVCMVGVAALSINEDTVVRVGVTPTSSFDDEESPKDKFGACLFM
jgi:hypothetical protein